MKFCYEYKNDVQFEMMDTEMLAKVEGGFGGWGRYGLLVYWVG